MKISLTLQQWAIVSLIAIVGVLVVVLKLQGSKLHAVKLALMQKELDILVKKDDDNIAQKKRALRKAKKELETSK